MRQIQINIEYPNAAPPNVKDAFQNILNAIESFEQLTCLTCRKCKAKIKIGTNTCISCARESEP